MAMLATVRCPPRYLQRLPGVAVSLQERLPMPGRTIEVPMPGWTITEGAGTGQGQAQRMTATARTVTVIAGTID